VIRSGVTTQGSAGEDRLSLTFAALADPTRRSIVERLALGALTVGELAEPFAMSQQAISKHLKVLQRAGLIAQERTAQSRPRVLQSTELDHALDWISRHRQVWAERYEQLDEHLASLQARTKAKAKGPS
jgi:DNA-binding transcriptional ArsR family regulator